MPEHNPQLILDALNIKLAVKCKNVPLKTHNIFLKNKKILSES